MIKENVKSLLTELPEGVQLVAAAKTRTSAEILEAAAGGVKIIGENYVQEAQKVFREVGRKVQWHFIGHLQKNKVKKIVEIADMIQTVDSYSLAEEIDKRCGASGKIMPVLIEINSGREKQKTGVLPEDAFDAVRNISKFSNIKIKGLMTMGPGFGNPDEARPYFTKTKEIFERIKKMNLPGVEMKYLSMGMTNSYKVALEEGANIVRIGSLIFGERGNVND
ncbi:MAG: YggS family pyridoxal phosphate-dependent enzyme [bacterium]